MKNSVLIEGVKTAGPTLDGRFAIKTSRYEGIEVKKLVILCKLSSALNSNEDVRKMLTNGTILQCIGRIESFSGDIGVYVEHFERIGARFGKYTFTNKN